jgi:RNA polymerase sigma-70 factor (ECF subfamily)
MLGLILANTRAVMSTRASSALSIRLTMERISSADLFIGTMEICVSELCDFDKVVERYWTRIFRLALALLRDEDAAQTVTQDCFVRAFRSRHAFRGDSSVHTWLVHIAVNLARNWRRNRRLQFWKRLVLFAEEQESIGKWMPDKSMSAESRLVVEQQLDAIWAATAYLPDRQRTVFLLRFVEEMELLDIARVLGVSEGSVKVHLFRALRSVRKQLGM